MIVVFKKLPITIVIIAILTVPFLVYSHLVYSADDHIVISEVQISGVAASDDFVELYNPTDSDYDLADHRLVKRTASGDSDSSIKSWTSEELIPAHGYYLWANNGWAPPQTPDASTSASIAANNGVALRQGPKDTGTVIDSVAWGTATNAFIESSVFPENPASGGSIERVGDDTNDNSVDFVLRETSDPQNSATVVTPTPTPTPTSPSPTASPTATPTPTETPTITPSPSPAPTATPSPSAKVIGFFMFPGTKKVCFLYYKLVKFGFMTVRFPRIVCQRI